MLSSLYFFESLLLLLGCNGVGCLGALTFSEKEKGAQTVVVRYLSEHIVRWWLTATRCSEIEILPSAPFIRLYRLPRCGGASRGVCAYRTKLETDLMRELNAPMLASGPTRPNWPSPYSHTSLVDIHGSYSLFTLLKSSTSEKITLLHVSKCFLMWFIMLLVMVLAGLSLIYFVEKKHAFI